MKKEDFDMPHEICGEKIKLVKREHCYDEQMWALIENSREFLREFLFWVDGTRQLEDVKNATDMFIQQWQDKESFDYFILAKDTGKVVGAGGLHDFEYQHNATEFGYLLDKAQTGKGYVAELVGLIEKLAFDKGMHRLAIEIDERNIASQKVAERAGYHLEGCLKDVLLTYDGYRSHKVYAKVKN